MKLLDRLLDGDVEVNSVDPAKEGRTALTLAAEGGHHECVKMLLQGGANPDLTFGPNGHAALHK